MIDWDGIAKKVGVMVSKIPELTREDVHGAFPYAWGIVKKQLFSDIRTDIFLCIVYLLIFLAISLLSLGYPQPISGFVTGLAGLATLVMLLQVVYSLVELYYVYANTDYCIIKRFIKLFKEQSDE